MSDERDREEPGRMMVDPETEEASRLQRKLQVRRFRLMVNEGPDAGKAYSSAGTRTVIGTHPSADLVLSDRTVSRFHCEISVLEGQALIRDLQSRNGTWVNGVPVLQAPLLDEGLITLGRTRLRFGLGRKTAELEASPRRRFGALVGASLSMRAAFALLERAAASDVTVLLEGETGTGKGLAAEAIHEHSARRDRPFITVDCGAIPPHLSASELFGHLRGAFTGAVESRMGALEAAQGGTLFLDEIGELEPDLQPQLLRAIDKKQVKRIGAQSYVPIDVRIIAATHRDLRAEVNAGRFRSDLYYRLAVLPIRLPSLAERRDDIPLLVEVLLERMGAEAGGGTKVLRSAGFLAHLARHSWPGNIRELRNYLERCLVLHGPEPLTIKAGGPALEVDTSKTLRAAREGWVAAFERRYLEKLLEEHRGKISAAARAADVDRTYFYRMLWRHGLR
jgi:DNA-binding NtrC family response regulator